MKSFILLFISALFITICSYAQPPKVVAAYNYIKYDEYDKAKEAIDPTITHPKTAEKEKTWYYRGIIYQNLYTIDKFRDLAPEGYDVAFESYKKALLLNFKDPANTKLDLENNVDDLVKFYTLINDQKTQYISSQHLADMIGVRLPRLANTYVNLGVDEFKTKKDYAKALSHFEKSLFISSLSMKQDTAVMYYAALSAEKIKDYQRAEKYLKQTVRLKYGTDDTERATIYCQYANIFLAQGDTVKFLENLEKGRKAYPNESVVLINFINHYITIGKPEKAEEMILLAIEKEPDNKLLRFNIATIYEGTGRTADAEAAYIKALEIDSMYFDAAYNLGAMYVNLAADLNKEASQLDISEEKKYNELLEKVKDNFKLALPHLEKAYKMKPDDAVTVKTLSQIYRSLGNLEKFEELTKIYKSLQGE